MLHTFRLGVHATGETTTPRSASGTGQQVGDLGSSGLLPPSSTTARTHHSRVGSYQAPGLLRVPVWFKNETQGYRTESEDDRR